jgi:predicted metal-binding protein
MKPTWHENLVLVCEKCGKKLQETSAKGAENPAVEMKDWLKKQLLAKSLWGRTRVVVTTCLDICPLGKVAVAFTSDRPDLETTSEIVDPIAERDRILHIAMERAKPAPEKLG